MKQARSPSCWPPRRTPRRTSPGPDDIYRVGTLGSVVQLLRLPDGTVKVLVEGKKRARIAALRRPTRSIFQVEAEEIEEVMRTHAPRSRR